MCAAAASTRISGALVEQWHQFITSRWLESRRHLDAHAHCVSQRVGEITGLLKDKTGCKPVQHEHDDDHSDEGESDGDDAGVNVTISQMTVDVDADLPVALRGRRTAIALLNGVPQRCSTAAFTSTVTACTPAPPERSEQ
jgi:hypothetical protein